MTRPTDEFQNYINERIKNRQLATNESYESAQAKEVFLIMLSSLLIGRDKLTLRIDKYAKDVMQTLMTNFVIRKGGVEYEIIETEFYLYCNKHKDVTTYPRSIAPGRFWFHDSGVDITLHSHVRYKDGKIDSEQSKFGGLLIRSLKRTEYKEDGAFEESYIFGPLNCIGELWNDFDAFISDVNDYPIIDFKPQPNVTVEFESRFYPVSEDKEKRVEKLRTLNNRYNTPVLDLCDFDAMLSRPFRAVRTDIISDPAMQVAVKSYKSRKPSLCPKSWLNE